MKSTIGRPRHAAFTAFSIVIIVVIALAATSCGKTATTQPASAADAASQAAAPSAATAAEAPAPAAGSAVPAGDASAGDAPSGEQPGTAAAPGSSQASSAETAPQPPSGGPAGPAAAAQTGPGATVPRKLGEIVYSEGSVLIQRAGASPERGDIGSVVRAFDVLVTGPKSRAEVDLGSGSPGGASIKLAENTAFYFDTEELSEAQRKTVVQLLSGSLAVKVDRLANGSFRVGTEQAVLGVRGTVFIVDTVPDGSLLVTCDSGAVEVTEGGDTVTAKPGGVVELTGTGGLKLLAVQQADLAEYRGDWRTDAYKSFASRALSYTYAYAGALESGKPALETALARLKAQEPALAAWRAARASGREPRFTDWIPEKKAVSAALFDCLKALFAIERPYYRLLELKALHDAGTGVGALKDGRSSAAYFKGFETANSGLARGMSDVREALLLFSWASAGSPMGDFFGSKAESLGTGSLFLED